MKIYDNSYLQYKHTKIYLKNSLSCVLWEMFLAKSLLVFKIITSTCDRHNRAWRDTATDALLTLTKSLDHKALNHMHQTQCVQTCLRSLKSEEICTANLIDKFQILATLLTFLKVRKQFLLICICQLNSQLNLGNKPR